MNIELYIQSGIVESYALGLATTVEREEFEQLMPHYPELKTALSDFEYHLELFAIENEVPPPPGLRDEIQARLKETPVVRSRGGRRGSGGADGGASYLRIESSSNTIRVHKVWKTLFIVVFALSKLFLILAIVYYIEYRHARADLRKAEEQTEQGVNAGGR